MTDLIKTDRLVLRRHKQSDAAEITRMISDWDVIKWLTSPPYPYNLPDAENFLSSDMAAETVVITMDDQFLGNVGLHSVPNSTALELGYWLGKPFWGQGLMTEAAKAVTANHFNHSDDTLLSGFLEGNTASNNVLRKLGFRNTEIVIKNSVPWNKKMPLQRMELTANVWRARYE